MDEINWVYSPLVNSGVTITVNGLNYSNFVLLTSLPVIVECGIGHTGNSYTAVITNILRGDHCPQLVQKLRDANWGLYGRGHNVNSAVMELFRRVREVVDSVGAGDDGFPKMADEDFTVRPFVYDSFEIEVSAPMVSCWTNNVLCGENNIIHVNQTQHTKPFLASVSIEPSSAHITIPSVIPFMRTRGKNIDNAVDNLLYRLINDKDYMVSEARRGQPPDMATELTIRYYELFK